ncbi:zinc finger protein ubi-d4-like isoform X3 [Lycorma delicatula]|uniref:zinc finger protein ubi-d4-like isoform X3 n=1 Tax=Lycorma delicatula TaxID=130591 RepID=UPI003F50E74A
MLSDIYLNCLLCNKFFMSDSAYREAIENSANYNTRLCIERRLRMPFLDPQTGLAQNHSNLFMSSRQRMPGLQEGQVYTYPSKRWRKKRRQYLMNMMQPSRRKEVDSDSNDLHSISTIENPGASAAQSEDSKDSSGLKEDATPKVPDAWFYDELDLQAMDGFDEPDPDSDYDYEEPYSKRKKKRTGPGKPGPRGAGQSDSPHPKKPKTPGPGRGRKKGMTYADLTDADKPFGCDLCGARYKTRPGLTYHYTHSHKERGSTAVTGDEEGSSEAPPSSPSANASVLHPPVQDKGTDPASVQGWTKFQDSYLTFLNTPGSASVKKQTAPKPSTPGPSSQSNPPPPPPPPPLPVIPAVTSEETSPHSNPPSEKKIISPPEDPMPILAMEQNEKERAAPSPYCDFCLGDAVVNKKSGQPEELVSCSDCGRSGHPTCLQFTANMIISVRKYRWQCIECKCCSICGNSDNDDQLLFCDDCDRGYHMYCLAPPLSSPPEGSWSCRLCLKEFHTK